MRLSITLYSSSRSFLPDASSAPPYSSLRTRLLRPRHSLVTLFLVFLFIHFFSADADGHATVTALAKNLQPITSTDEVKCIRFADSSDISVTQNMQLDVGDELYSVSGEISVEVRCGSSSKFIPSGQFRIVILPSYDRDCAIYVMSGNADVQSAQPTSVSAGETNMGSNRTQYGVRVSRTQDGPSQEYYVYEGEVRISSPVLENTLVTGEKLAIKPGELSSPRRIDSEDILRTSALYALVETSKAVLGDRGGINAEEVYATLKRLHVAVLTAPQNSRYRLDLAVEQIKHSASLDAIYHLNKAIEIDSVPRGSAGGRADARQTAATALMKGLAFDQVGRFNDANEQFNEARRIDPGVFADETLLNRMNRASRERTLIQRKRVEPQTGQTGPSKDEQAHAQSMRLIGLGRYKEAIIGFETRIKAGRANSRDYYGLAVAYYKDRSNESANVNASRALEMHQKDGLLSADEYVDCKRILEETAPGSSPRKPPETAQSLLLDRLKRGDYKDAYAGFMERTKLGIADSMDYYGLAAALDGLRSQTAGDQQPDVDKNLIAWATKAIELNKQDRRLTKEAYSTCQKILDAARARSTRKPAAPPTRKAP